MTSPDRRGSTPRAASSRSRLVGVADRLLAAAGLTRSARSDRAERQAERVADAAAAELAAQAELLAGYRGAWGRLAQATGAPIDDPDAAPAPEEAEVTALVKALRRRLGGTPVLPGATELPGGDRVVVRALREAVHRAAPAQRWGLALDFAAAGGVVAALGPALVAIAQRRFVDAHAGFAAAGDTALRLAPVETLVAASHVDRAAAAALGERLFTGDALGPDIRLEAAEWIGVAEQAAMLQRADLASAALAAAEAMGLAGVEDEHASLAAWLVEAEARPQAEPGEIVVGLIDYKQPSFATSSSNLGDHVQTVAAMGHVLRHRGVRFTGDPELVALADEFGARVRDDRAITDSASATVRLVQVQRDASDLQQLPDATWLVTFGWYAQPRPDGTFAMPMHPGIRPLFVSVHIAKPELLTPEAIAAFRANGPVGCRDWTTVHLLHAAGVDAFFSGCITTTVDTLFPGEPGERGGGDLWVDVPKRGPGDTWTQLARRYRMQPFGENMRDAIARLDTYRDVYDTVHTSRLHSYLPGRSIGADVAFSAKRAADPRFDGLIGIDDAAFDRIRTGILDLLAEVYRAILAGDDEAAVRARWRELTAPKVAEAAAVRAALTAEPVAPTADVAAAIAAVRDAARVLPGRTPEPGDLALELSFDAGFTTQFAVMLDAIAAHTSVPVHAHLLTRGVDLETLLAITGRHPSIAVTWLPCDAVDYGRVGLLPHTSVATMDRLLLPELLPDLDRIAHVDLDAIAVGDLAPLADVDLAGHPLAARSGPEAARVGGFAWLRGLAQRMRADRAREFIARTHERLPFDFSPFNAGVMVLDLARMRADDFTATYLPWATRFGLHDQDVLDVYAGADHAELDDRFNRLVRDEPVDGAVVLHWAGTRKPWNDAEVAGAARWRDAAAGIRAEVQEENDR